VNPEAWDRLRVTARRQAGAFSYDQALEAGLAPATVSRYVRSGLFVRLAPSIYAMSGSPITPTTREYAGLLRLGAESTLSHISAAAVLRLLPQPSVPWLSIPAHRRAPARRDGLIVVRVRQIEMLRLGDGRRITPLPRTLVDLAQCLDQRELTATYLTAMQRDPGVVADIGATLDRLGRGYPGVGLGRKVLDEFSPEMESILGAELFGLLRPHCDELEPGMTVVLPDGSIRVFDLGVRRLRLDVEADSWAFHGSKAQQNANKHRDTDLFVAGYHTQRFDTDDIRRAPEQTVRRFLAVLTRRERDLAA